MKDWRTCAPKEIRQDVHRLLSVDDVRELLPPPTPEQIRLVPSYRARRKMMLGTGVYYTNLEPWLVAPIAGTASQN